MEFSEGQKAKILKYLLAGIGVGAGTNLALNLVSYLKDKYDEAKDSEDKEKILKSESPIYEISKDDLAFLNKSASSADVGIANNTVAQALAILALTGGLYGGYAVSNKLHDKIKENELSEQNKSEVENYYKTLYLLQKANKKTASCNDGSMTKTAEAFSTLLGTGLGLILLTALGSALTTRSIMKKQYPKLDINKKLDKDYNSLLMDSPEIPIFKEVDSKKDDDQKNKKDKESVELDSDIQKDLFKDKNETQIESSDDPFSKMEKLSYDNCSDYINENILKLSFEFEKLGKPGSVTSLVKAASCGFVDNLKDIVLQPYNDDYTIFDLADDLMSKYANINTYGKDDQDIRDQLSLTWLASEPSVSAAIMPQISAEFIINTPALSKLASECNDINESTYCGLIMSAVMRSRTNAFKSLSEPLNKFSKSIDLYTNKKFASSKDTYKDTLVEGIEKLLKSNYSIQDAIRINLCE